MNRIVKFLYPGRKRLKFNESLIKRVSYSTSSKPIVVLGIETSCDDTGVALVDSTGKILGEALNSQQVIHLR